MAKLNLFVNSYHFEMAVCIYLEQPAYVCFGESQLPLVPNQKKKDDHLDVYMECSHLHITWNHPQIDYMVWNQCHGVEKAEQALLLYKFLSWLGTGKR